MGVTSLRPGQDRPILAALAGADSLVVMPTGSGKSLCFQAPAFASGGLTVVVSPLIALIQDQHDRLAAAGLPVAMVTSLQSGREMHDAIARIERGEVRLVLCAPERFAHEAFTRAVQANPVDLLAIDEAHCVSEWGHDFRPEYLQLARLREMLAPRAVMALTATATPAVSDEITARLGLRDPVTVRTGFDRPNLAFDVVRLDGKGAVARKWAMLEAGLAAPEGTPAIVYCGTRRATEEVAEGLQARGFRAVGYHAGMDDADRVAAQDAFMSGEADVIAATNAFGMGIDRSDVRGVWHWSIPTSLEGYYQEAGRGGRDGLPGRAVLLAMRADLGRLIRFANQHDGPDGGRVARDRAWTAYRGINAYIESPTCRRQAILDHFGDTAPGSPTTRCCDVCHPPADLRAAAGAHATGPRSARGGGGAGSDRGEGGRSIRLRRDDRAPETERDVATPLTPEEEQLFEQLREWRRERADGKPAYTVCADAALRTIAVSRPADEAALLAVKGVGPAFVERHSASLFDVLQQAA
ncbi:MAG: ATP-dependent DNA helicase RecQ [Actinobacteria bacterium]|nr:ATP-dependent DNA helicase RecQ [Actinomycetota bacterium]